MTGRLRTLFINLLFLALGFCTSCDDRAAGPAAVGAADPDAVAAWPVAEGYADPNRVVYDEARCGAFLTRISDGRPTACGIARYEVVTAADGPVTFVGGLDESHLGRRFHAGQLVRFLESRPGREDAVPPCRAAADDPRFGAELRAKSFSLWERDLVAAMRLVSGA